MTYDMTAAQKVSEALRLIEAAAVLLDHHLSSNVRAHSFTSDNLLLDDLQQDNILPPECFVSSQRAQHLPDSSKILWSGMSNSQQADLGRSTGGVHQAHSTLPNIRSVQGAGEELVVGLVDGVAALEGQHILALWQGGPYLRRAGTGEYPLGQLQPLHLAPCKLKAQ